MSDDLILGCVVIVMLAIAIAVVYSTGGTFCGGPPPEIQKSNK